MYFKIPKRNLILIDIETVKKYHSLEQADERLKALVIKRHQTTLKFEPNVTKDVNEHYDKNMALYPEYNQVVCIGLRFFMNNKSYTQILTGSEEDIIIKFIKLLYKITKHSSNAGKKLHLFGHNISRFDVPILIKKCFQYGICPHPILGELNQKPWDKRVLDSYEIWKQQSSTLSDNSLDAVAYVLGIPSPKDEGDGSNVEEWFRNDEIDKIKVYQRKDINTLEAIIDKLINLKDLSNA